MGRCTVRIRRVDDGDAPIEAAVSDEAFIACEGGFMCALHRGKTPRHGEKP